MKASRASTLRTNTSAQFKPTTCAMPTSKNWRAQESSTRFCQAQACGRHRTIFLEPMRPVRKIRSALKILQPIAPHSSNQANEPDSNGSWSAASASSNRLF